MSDTVKRMDRAEISKRVERAEKLLQKGKTDAALEEYLQILAADPTNDSICQMASDLCLSLQRIPEAVGLLGEMFERQIQAGDATRASLTYKKLARFVNPTWEQKVRFGELLENNNRKLALETYENAFEELSNQGRKQESLSVLQRVLKLDSSEKNLVRLGELSSELGDGKGAAAAFLRISDIVRAAGGNGASWIERAYAEDPTDPQTALAYSKGLVDQGQVGDDPLDFSPLEIRLQNRHHFLHNRFQVGDLAIYRVAANLCQVQQLIHQQAHLLSPRLNAIKIVLSARIEGGTKFFDQHLRKADDVAQGSAQIVGYRIAERFQFFVRDFQLGRPLDDPQFEVFIESEDFALIGSPLCDIAESRYSAANRTRLIEHRTGANLNPRPLDNFWIAHKHLGRARLSPKRANQWDLLSGKRGDGVG